jgi:dihydroorotate dehydrogenase
VRFGSSRLNWNHIWGSDVSPLIEFGVPGGLSGEPLRELNCNWIRDLRKAGFTKPINGGGGIFHPRHVLEYRDAGASSIFLGSIASLRPWNVQPCIKQANSITWR